jgi:hypothetical protein
MTARPLAPPTFTLAVMSNFPRVQTPLITPTFVPFTKTMAFLEIPSKFNQIFLPEKEAGTWNSV